MEVSTDDSRALIASFTAVLALRITPLFPISQVLGCDVNAVYVVQSLYGSRSTSKCQDDFLSSSAHKTRRSKIFMFG